MSTSSSDRDRAASSSSPRPPKNGRDLMSLAASEFYEIKTPDLQGEHRVRFEYLNVHVLVDQSVCTLKTRAR